MAHRLHWPWFMGLLMGLTSTLSHADHVFPIGEFAKDYSATITVSDQDFAQSSGSYYSGPGVIRVFDQHQTPLIKLDAELFFDITNGAAHVNVHQLPYGEQSVLIYQDVNFDGRNDLALMAGHYSCYGGPAFNIYLSQADHTFKESSEFTRLASEYCGLFDVDETNKTLHTMTKSGCCWHQFETYRVQDDKPVLQVSQVSDFYKTPYEQLTTTRFDSGKESATIEYHLPEFVLDELGYLLRFKLKKHPEKQVIVFVTQERIEYALLKGDQVEYSADLAKNGLLPWQLDGAVKAESATEHKVQAFSYAAGQLSFRSGRTRYTVVDDGQHLGVNVIIGKKTIFLEGDPATRKGSLAHLRAGAYHNL